MFNITSKLVKEHSDELLSVICLENSPPFCARPVLSHDQAIKWAKAKVCVHADSMLCVGQIKDSHEVLTRTLDVSGSRIGREVVW